VSKDVAVHIHRVARSRLALPTRSEEDMPVITPSEQEQVDRANASGRTPVVFIHGLWLLASSWDRWTALFEEAGYAAVAPGWPDDPATVAEALARPEAFAGKTVGQVADHFEGIAARLTCKPVLVGHSFGGLITQILAGRGLAAAAVAIDPAPFRGVLPLPLSALKASLPVLRNPLNRRRAVSLTAQQFRFAFANAVEEADARALYETFAVAAPGAPIFQAATANLNPWTEAKVHTKNPDRGPLLITSGQKDHTVPWAIANASFKRQRRNPGPTEIIEVPNRGHALTIDDGWREVAEIALAFIGRFAPVSSPAHANGRDVRRLPTDVTG
jgi:pimeloyl-ACP methyl ester carboxylesterase